ncbi:MAG: ABC transporter permease [Rhodocyclaceae bacterium]|nr:MAG: ABC transporter permease [Rhodocyclaceae bacterium]
MAFKEKISALTFDPRGLVLPALFLVAWQFVTDVQWVDTRIIVPPVDVVAAGWKWFLSGELVSGLQASLWRDGSGFLLGALLGIALGVLLGVSRFADAVFGPTFHSLKHISLFAWIPLISAFFGRDDLAKVVFVALSTLYPVALGTLEGIRNIAKSQSEVARVYGFTPRQALFRLVLPAASPQIIAGLHLGLIYAWLATVGGEFILASVGEGIGLAVIRGRASFHVDLILVGMLVIGLVGLVFNTAANHIEARLLHWRGNHS